MKGVKHLIQCHCILPQYKNSPEPIFHKFVVFSEIDEEDNFVTKLAQCNNCGVIHKVVDACKSEIVRGMEESSAILTIPEIKKSLTLDLCSILETYKCDIATWENVKFIYDNSLWGNNVVISKDEVDEITQIKVLKIIDENKIKIDTGIYDTVLTKE